MGGAEIAGFRPGAETAFFSDGEAIAEAVVAAVGKQIVLALPLGLGKANTIVNALVERAVRDSTIRLEIFTALTLERPVPSNEYERRFLTPAMDRLFGKYPALSYAALLRENRLPDNIRVSEFYLNAGQWTGNERAQREYVSANYTHVLEYVYARGANVVAQLMARREREGRREYSLSCNPDLSIDLLEDRRAGRIDVLFAAEVNNELPFLAGDALVEERDLDMVLDNPDGDFELFSAPRAAIRLEDQAIGLHASRLVPDGGTLQIGIGSVGDAVTHGLILRHTRNETFRRATNALAPNAPATRVHDAPFETGLYGLSEMFVNGFLELARHGILKRAVDGAVLHGGFFVESREFYAALREMPEDERAKFQMKPISFINQLYGDEEAKRAARTGARFMNQAMIATLLGAVVSDGVESGTVVSGVGGQYNFVAQAFGLHDARSVIAVNAVRRSKGKTQSNIRWSYGHQTIPRHLRDVVVTEYGVADLRGKTDEDVVIEMLSVTDSRYQDELMERAKSVGKLRRDYAVPAPFRENTPERIEDALSPFRAAGDLPVFPFGTSFTETEQRLLPALGLLKESSGSTASMARLFLRGMRASSSTYSECIERMALDAPSSLREYVYQKLLLGALAKAEPRPDE